MTDFFENEVKNYSIYACERAIPSGIDGLKPSQRKVIFGMQKKFPTQEVKVSIASAGIMEISAYHHGSLDGVIVNMSQSFAGSNNMPLLDGIGQFGSRISSDPAASRYIFTKVSNVCKQLFKSVDDNILEWNVDDDIKVEPKYYLPIMPLLLINGAEGMGTGFASRVFAYNPKDLKEAILSILKGKTAKPLVPWFRGFKGTISKENDQTIISGCLEVVNTTNIKITELPIGQYTIRYRDVLNTLEDKGLIKSYDDMSTEEYTLFSVKVAREITSKSHHDLLKMFKLISKDSENLTVWDENFKIRKFDNVNQLLEWFVKFRLTKYDDRKAFIIKDYTEKLEWLSEQSRFIKLYLKNSANWSKKKIDDIKKELIDAKFTRIDDLLSIRISKLTGDSITEHETNIANLQAELKALKTMTNTEMYVQDLTALKLDF